MCGLKKTKLEIKNIRMIKAYAVQCRPVRMNLSSLASHLSFIDDCKLNMLMPTVLLRKRIRSSAYVDSFHGIKLDTHGTRS